ncbi:hypothetical protein OK016_22135 [Vibrio chagasii]|nr:hypothetical protein [Vibrio chagasii]
MEGNVVQQDVDDVNGHGPETITIPNYQDADMHYSVHNYTNRSWDVMVLRACKSCVRWRYAGRNLQSDLADKPIG